MALRHLLLGLLVRPASGYDLKRQFNKRLRHFWAAELAQIYPALQQLERDGLLKVTIEPPLQGPPRKVYKRRPRALKAVREWLLAGPEVRRDRISYLGQVYFLDQLGDRAAAREFLTELRANLAKQLDELRAIERDWQNNDPLYPDQLPDENFYPQLTLRFGMTRLAATVDWCDESIARIDSRA